MMYECDFCLSKRLLAGANMYQSFASASKGFIEVIAVLALWGMVSGERRSGEKKTTR